VKSPNALWRTLPLRAHLVVLALAAASPLVMLLAYAGHREAARRERFAGEAMLALADVVAADVGAHLDRSRTRLERLARRPRVAALDPAHCDPFLGDFASLDESVGAIGTVDAAGRAVCVGGAADTSGVRVADAAWFRAVMRSDTAVVGGPVVRPVTGRWVVVLAAPLRGPDGAPRGAVAGSVELERFLWDAVDAPTLADGRVTIVDSAGVVVARSLQPGRWIGQDVADSGMVAASGTRTRGTVRALGLAGDERIHGFASVPGVGWRVFVGQSVETVLAPLGAAAALRWLVVVPILALGAVLAWELGTWMTRPVTALAGAARAAAAGTDPVVEERGPAEVRDLAREFNAQVARRAAAEARARDMASQYRLLFDANPLPMWLFDPVTLRFLAVNDAALRQYRYTRDDFLRMTIADIRPAEDVGHLLAHLAAQAAPTHVDTGTWRHRRKDGAVLEVEVSSDAAVWLGRPARLVVAHDVTQQRRTDRMFRRAVESAPHGALIVARDGTILLANPRVERIFGYRTGELTGRAVEVLLPGALRDGHRGHRASFWTDPRERAMGAGRDLTGLHQDGREVPVEIGLTPIETDEGPAVFASVVDVTERHRAEARLREALEAVRRLAAGLERAREAERTRIARELHDELGQALTGLKMDLAWVRPRVPDDPALRERVRAMLDLADATVAVVRRIAGELRPGVLDDLGLAAAMRWQARQFEQRASVRVVVEAAELPDLDPERATALFRIFQETLTNVARHAAATVVHARVALEDDAVVLTVADDGRGITPDEARGRTGSLGVLGMRERAEAWGGGVAIEGLSGRGTTVTVRLPAGAGAPAHR
jgi:PAS domain S-box-containing protein